jgi:hypothetical protein
MFIKFGRDVLKSLKITAPANESEKRSWVEKVTDDDNYWLLARNCEKDGLFEKAAEHYLNDAKEQMKYNTLRTALSLCCAGNCFAKTNREVDASRSFVKAIQIYKNVLNGKSNGKFDSTWLKNRINYCRNRASKQNKRNMFSDR